MTESYAKPLPTITPLNRPFWDNARDGKLTLQTCESCGDVHYPAAPVCPCCLSADQDWKVASGRGTLESWIQFHRAYWPGFNAALPYWVCFVRLEEGPILVSNLLGDVTCARLGAPVRVVFEQITPDILLPKFEIEA